LTFKNIQGFEHFAALFDNIIYLNDLSNFDTDYKFKFIQSDLKFGKLFNFSYFQELLLDKTFPLDNDNKDNQLNFNTKYIVIKMDVSKLSDIEQNIDNIYFNKYIDFNNKDFWVWKISLKINLS
jgi:hypothetical protein